MEIEHWINRLTNKRDFFFLLVLGVILIYIGSGAVSMLSEKNLPFLCPLIKAPELIRVTFFFILLAFLFEKVARPLLKEIEELGKKDKTYSFRDSDWPGQWVFNGKTEPEGNYDLRVRSSRAGCLLDKYYWKNFTATFELKFKVVKADKGTKVNANRDRVGFIFRAEDLGNYFMVQISREEGGKFSITPHIRYSDGWEVFTKDECKPKYSNFSKIFIKVEDNVVSVDIKGTPVLRWILPTHVDVNHREAGVSSSLDEKDTLNVHGHVREIPFRLSYGRVGFRAHMVEEALVRGLKISPLEPRPTPHR